jgi:uncharacterized damage-inducible protein DinB
MKRDYLIQIANFNHWADCKVIDWLHQINDEQWEQVNISSFSSIRETAIHIVSAEKIWVENWLRIPDPIFLSMEFKGTKKELIEIWKKSSVDIKTFVEGCPEENYLQPVNFKYPRDGRIGNMAFWQTVAHAINHSTYHRGQLVTLLRQAAFINLSSIDMATYFQLNKI